MCFAAKFGAKTNFVKKAKMAKFRTKNTLFGYLGIEFSKAIVIFRMTTLEFVKLQIS